MHVAGMVAVLASLRASLVFFFKSNAVSELVIDFLYTIGVFLCGRAATATSAPPKATPS